MIYASDSAFPWTSTNANGHSEGEGGMALRAFIATEALKGLLANPSGPWPGGTDMVKIQKELSRLAVGYADALIKELNRE